MFEEAIYNAGSTAFSIARSKTRVSAHGAARNADEIYSDYVAYLLSVV